MTMNATNCILHTAALKKNDDDAKKNDYRNDCDCDDNCDDDFDSSSSSGSLVLEDCFDNPNDTKRSSSTHTEITTMMDSFNSFSSFGGEFSSTMDSMMDIIPEHTPTKKKECNSYDIDTGRRITTRMGRRSYAWWDDHNDDIEDNDDDDEEDDDEDEHDDTTTTNYSYYQQTSGVGSRRRKSVVRFSATLSSSSDDDVVAKDYAYVDSDEDEDDDGNAESSSASSLSKLWWSSEDLRAIQQAFVKDIRQYERATSSHSRNTDSNDADTVSLLLLNKTIDDADDDADDDDEKDCNNTATMTTNLDLILLERYTVRYENRRDDIRSKMIQICHDANDSDSTVGGGGRSGGGGEEHHDTTSISYNANTNEEEEEQQELTTDVRLSKLLQRYSSSMVQEAYQIGLQTAAAAAAAAQEV